MKFTKKIQKKFYILAGVVVIAVLIFGAYLGNSQFFQGNLRNIGNGNLEKVKPMNVVKLPLVSCHSEEYLSDLGNGADLDVNDFGGNLKWVAQMSDNSSNVIYNWSGDMLNGKTGSLVEVVYPYEYLGKTAKAHVKAYLLNGETREADCKGGNVFGFNNMSSMTIGMTLEVSCKAELYPLQSDDGKKNIIWTAKVDKLIVPGYQGAPGLDFTQSVQGSNAKYEWHGHGLEGKSQNSLLTSYEASDNTKVEGLVKISVANLVPWVSGTSFTTAECNYDLSKLNPPIVLNKTIKNLLLDEIK
jgi:hypothetical protein